jgi:hypothetical protein
MLAHSYAPTVGAPDGAIPWYMVDYDAGPNDMQGIIDAFKAFRVVNDRIARLAFVEIQHLWVISNHDRSTSSRPLLRTLAQPRRSLRYEACVGCAMKTRPDVNGATAYSRVWDRSNIGPA